MNVFTKLGLALLLGVISTTMLLAQHSPAEIAAKNLSLLQSQQVNDVNPDAKPSGITYQSDALFDLQFSWPAGVGGGEAGIETDGNYIYTTKWNGTGEFYRYGMDGAYIGVITVTGAAGVRDLAYNGTYFYGAAANTTVMELDLANATKLGQFTAPAAIRAIAYNEDDNVFYGNNWSEPIQVFGPTGASQGSFPSGPGAVSIYGMAYDNYCGGQYLWAYAQPGTTPATQNVLFQKSLPSGAETGVTFDVATVVTPITGIAGGLCITDEVFSGYWTIMGMMQNEFIWGLELCSSGPALTNDIGIMSIVEPTTGVGLGDAEAVTVTIKNFGTAPQSNYSVYFTLDGGSQITETISATINGGATYDHTFGTTVDLSELGDYVIMSCTMLAGDQNTANDCKTKPVSNVFPEYCTASTTNEDECIGNVLCGDIDNASGWQGGIADYTDQSTSIDAGSSEDITVTSGCNIWAADIVYCWVDWNMDYQFGVGGDEEFILNNVGAAGITYEGAITVPAGTPNGDYRMRVRMTYSTAPVPCGESLYGEVEEYTITVGGGSSGCENFDALTVGGLVAGQLGGMWTTWGGTSADDATVSDMYSNSPSNSFVVDAGTVDLVLKLADDPITSGEWFYSHYMYVPTGFSGYFNVQSSPTPGVAWVCELFFNDDGTGNVTENTIIHDFTYSMDQWFMVEVNFDFGTGMAQVYFDGSMIVEWANPAASIGGIDYYGWDIGGTPGAYYDDVCFAGIAPPPLAPPVNLNGPDLVTAGNDILLTWSAPGSGPGGFFEDFEGGTLPTGWLAIDNDGDGFNWINTVEQGFGFDAYEGLGCMTSASYDNTAGPLTPDNYLITPAIQINAGAELSYYHDAQDPLYADDFYYVKLSTTGTAISDFTETLWSGTTPANWTEVTIDLSAYAGNMCYIAFHHTECTDWFWMKIDNFNVSDSKSKSQFTPSVTAPANQGMPFRTSGMSESEILETYANYNGNGSSKALLGYNVYRALNSGSPVLVDFTTLTTYTDNVSVTGVYTYCVTAVYDEGESDCSNEHVVDVITGVNEQLFNSTKLFPNPATGFVNINSDYNIESVSVYNFAGQIVLSEIVNKSTYRVNTSNLGSGIYLFQIETEEGRISKRIVIE